MIHLLFDSLVVVHVVAGAVSLACFWLPVFARKRRGLHTRAGIVFARAMMITAACAGVAATMTLLWPLATHPEVAPDRALNVRLGAGLMLAYLSAITFVAAYSGLRAVRLRGDHSSHRRGAEVALNVVALALAVAVLVAGLYFDATLLIALSFIGILGLPGNLRFIFRPPASRREWLYQHMGSMLGAGIAAHTAFLVFGAARIAPALANEPIVWLLPALIGVPASSLWIRSYRRRDSQATGPARDSAVTARAGGAAA